MLDKQINLFSVNTDAFLTDRERYIKSSMMKIKNDMYDVSNAISNLGKNHIEEKNLLLDMHELLKEELKEIESDTKESLKLEFSRNLWLDKSNKNNIRTLDSKYIRYKDKNGVYKDNLNNIVSMFTSDLSRSFKIEKDELTKDIIVVEIWYYDVGKDLILNGFYLDGKKYVYFSSSAGQIRTKKAVFVEESKYEQCKSKLMCGLTIEDINKKGGMNINKFLAYLALCNSATETWKDIFHQEFDIDRCIVVDDFETNVSGVADYINHETYEIEENKEDDFMIPHMDGAGLIISSYTDKNFMVRLPWIKGLLGSFDYIRFLNENNCSAKVLDIWGKEYDIIEDNIQIIFTKSQLKMYKYYSSWDDYKKKFKDNNCDACVCNIEESYISNAKINYQMIQTLHDMSHDEIVGICKKSNQKIEKISNSLENMLEVFGVTENRPIHEKNYFKQALKLYPELIKDKSNKDTLRDLKNSLVNKYKSSKLEIDGKFMFVLPDLYAFCEWLFMGVENPVGLISNGEVSCKPYKNHSELDCLRSPSLYIEHAVRRNVYRKKYRNEMLESWFTTNAIYISTRDLISRTLQLDK